MNIIITGKTSYIGTNVCAFFNSRGFNAKTISIRNGLDKINFKDTDIVIHCAAIVHKKEKNLKEDQKMLYKQINFKLAVETAKKAKKNGVKHFIFISSMSVYGDSVSKISYDTPLKPKTLYAKSKLMAEKEILKIEDKNFIVSIIRPPMVYGKDCPGNYKKLSNIIKKFPIFPVVNNKKSMIYIENLSFFIFNIAKDKKSGIFTPMDSKYISTSYMAEIIAKTLEKNIIMSKTLGKFINIINKTNTINIIKKSFGNLYYDEIIAKKVNYISFEEAIKKTEKNL